MLFLSYGEKSTSKHFILILLLQPFYYFHFNCSLQRQLKVFSSAVSVQGSTFHPGLINVGQTSESAEEVRVKAVTAKTIAFQISIYTTDLSCAEHKEQNLLRAAITKDLRLENDVTVHLSFSFFIFPPLSFIPLYLLRFTCFSYILFY